jgi:hypothetical protein
MDDFKTVVKSFAEIPALLAKLETYCFEFAIEFLHEHSGNFHRIDSHFTAEGLTTSYRCARDGRIYDVTIVPRKGA